tara:strand:- start:168 stop:500 length:333 start_codon:yes stop_codon:yes gene_type:complete
MAQYFNDPFFVKKLFRTLRNRMAGHFNFRYSNLSVDDYFMSLTKSRPNWIAQRDANNYRIFVIDHFPRKWNKLCGDSRAIEVHYADLRFYLYAFNRDITQVGGTQSVFNF